jgi:cellulose synthase/poly-beta-1,6-N-acetylglucosamine synthase-like glycosyltransferase
MEQGYGAMYSRERFGHGLTPDHFAGYKKQRFRWAYGAMQIMKAHAGKMFSNATKLTFWQKYHFVAGWLPWFADALNLIFTWAGLAWLLAVILPPQFGIKPVGLPPAEFILPTIGIFVFKLLYSFGLYFDRVRCTFRQSVGASLAGLALTYTVGRAVIYGLATSRLPFMRTPKMDERATLGMAFGMARGEAVLAALLWLGAAVLWVTNGQLDPEARLWSLFMIVQSLPYAAAVYVSMVNALEQMRHARTVFEAAPAARMAGPAMQPAQ